MSSAGNAPSTKSTTLFVCKIRAWHKHAERQKGLPQSSKRKEANIPISLIDFHRLTLGGRPPSFGTFTASALITLPYI